MAASKVAEAYVLFRADMGTFKADVKTIPKAIKEALGTIGSETVLKPALKGIGRALKIQLFETVNQFSDYFKKVASADNPLFKKIQDRIDRAVKSIAPGTMNIAKEFRVKLVEGVMKADEILRKAAAEVERRLKAAAYALGIGFGKAAARKPDDDTTDQKAKAAAKASAEAEKARAKEVRDKEAARSKELADANRAAGEVAKNRAKAARDAQQQKQSRQDALKSELAGGLGLSGMGELGGSLLGKAGPFAAILAGAVLAMKAVHELRESIKAALAESTRKFDLKWAPGAHGYSKEQLERMNEAMRGNTAFSKKEVTGAQVELSRHQEVKGTQFTGALKAAGDLATVMGIDLPAAAGVMGDALTDPLSVANGALDKYGILLTRAQENQIKNAVATRDFARAQDLVLEAFKQYGGAAEDFATRPESAMKKFENSVDNLREKVGSKLLPIFTKVVERITMGFQIAAAAVEDFDGATDIVWTSIKLGVHNTLDTIGDFFKGVAGFAVAGWGAMVAAGEEAFDQIENLFTGKSSKNTIMGQMEKAWDKGLEKTLGKWSTGQSQESKDLEKQLDAQVDGFLRRNKLIEAEKKKGLDSFNEAPANKPTDYKGPKFQFEFVGVTDLYKKIQEAIQPSETVKLQEMGVKAAQEAVNQQKITNGHLGEMKYRMKLTPDGLVGTFSE